MEHRGVVSGYFSFGETTIKKVRVKGISTLESSNLRSKQNDIIENPYETVGNWNMKSKIWKSFFKLLLLAFIICIIRTFRVNLLRCGVSLRQRIWTFTNQLDSFGSRIYRTIDISFRAWYEEKLLNEEWTTPFYIYASSLADISWSVSRSILKNWEWLPRKLEKFANIVRSDM